MDTDTSFLLSSPHCFSHWYLLSTGEQGIILCVLEMEGLQIRYSNGVQAHLLHSISWFHQFTKTTFTDYFSHNTKCLLNIFFTLTTKEFIQTTNNVSIKTTVLFYEHWWGFIQRKRRKFLITVMVINIEAAIPGQTKDLSSLTSSLWKWLLSPLCMKMLFRLNVAYLPLPVMMTTHYTTHDVWLGIPKSIINQKCCQMMGFIIGPVT